MFKKKVFSKRAIAFIMAIILLFSTVSFGVLALPTDYDETKLTIKNDGSGTSYTSEYSKVYEYGELELTILHSYAVTRNLKFVCDPLTADNYSYVAFHIITEQELVLSDFLTHYNEDVVFEIGAADATLYADNGDVTITRTIPANYTGWVVIARTDLNLIEDGLTPEQIAYWAPLQCYYTYYIEPQFNTALDTGKEIYIRDLGFIDDIYGFENAYANVSSFFETVESLSKDLDVGFGFYGLINSEETKGDFLRSAYSNNVNTYIVNCYDEDEITEALIKADETGSQVFVVVSPALLVENEYYVENSIVQSEAKYILDEDWETLFDDLNQVCVDSGSYSALAGWYFDEPLCYKTGTTEEEYPIPYGTITPNDFLSVTEYNHDEFGKRVLAIMGGVTYCQINRSGLSSGDFATRNAWIDPFYDDTPQITPEVTQYVTDVGINNYDDLGFYDSYYNDLRLSMGSSWNNAKIWHVPATMKMYGSSMANRVAHINKLYDMLKREKNPGGLLCYYWSMGVEPDPEDWQIGAKWVFDTNSEYYSEALASRTLEISEEIVTGEFVSINYDLTKLIIKNDGDGTCYTSEYSKVFENDELVLTISNSYAVTRDLKFVCDPCTSDNYSYVAFHIRTEQELVLSDFLTHYSTEVKFEIDEEADATLYADYGEVTITRTIPAYYTGWVVIARTDLNLIEDGLSPAQIAYWAPLQCYYTYYIEPQFNTALDTDKEIYINDVGFINDLEGFENGYANVDYDYDLTKLFIKNDGSGTCYTYDYSKNFANDELELTVLYAWAYTRLLKFVCDPCTSDNYSYVAFHINTEQELVLSNLLTHYSGAVIFEIDEEADAKLYADNGDKTVTRTIPANFTGWVVIARTDLNLIEDGLSPAQIAYWAPLQCYYTYYIEPQFNTALDTGKKIYIRDAGFINDLEGFENE